MQQLEDLQGYLEVLHQATLRDFYIYGNVEIPAMALAGINSLINECKKLVADAKFEVDYRYEKKQGN